MVVATRVAAVTGTMASASLRHVDVAVAAAVVVVDAVVAHTGRMAAGLAEGGVAGGLLSVTRVVGLELEEGPGPGLE